MTLGARKGRRLALVLFCAAFATPLFASEAEVVTIVGKGEAREAGSSAWRPAVLKEKLKGGAFVRTGDLSNMALLMQDRTQLRLSQNSLLQIKESTPVSATRLDLQAGRAWANAKGRATDVTIETRGATAGIRGTEWELEVDPATGRTLLAVFSGTVEFSNPQGRVTVGNNEAAIAEVGKAPVKIALTNPRDRVQWVNSFAVEPRRYADAAKAAPVVRDAVAAISSGDLARARTMLEAEKARGTRDTAVHRLLAELALVAGENSRAIGLLREGLAIAPGNPELLGALAGAQLMADQADEARRTVALPRDAETAGILVAQGEVARRDGDVAGSLSAFTRATTVAPSDDRGWFALGRAQNEREDTTRARRNLAKALELNPAGAGYQGELGTLETFANRFGDAQAAFDKALERNPSDYVALTGLGLLRLKRGDAQGALDAFLRAGVLEPRFSRARTYTAVAYYQLGQHAAAISTFREAAALDEKDPLPYLFLTQIYTDLFRAGEAVDASREALKRLPYLKSLNQVANDQQGSANMGYSLAFFGLEAWALEVAQQSYSPYLAVSHLFLADRYSGLYNKNSELIQGFLTDPTAFGGSNRFATLTPRIDSYGTLGYSYSYGDNRLSNPYLRLNGLTEFMGPGAYFLDAESGAGTAMIDTTAPNGTTTRVKGDRRAELYALGLGLQPSENLGIFGFATRFRDNVVLRDASGTFGTFDKDRGDVGLRYRFSPTSMTWLKLGATKEERGYDNYTVFSPDFSSGFSSDASFTARPEDVQGRHSIDLTPRDHVSFGYEQARDKRTGYHTQVGVVLTDTGFLGYGLSLYQEARLDSRQAYVSYVRDIAPRLTAQADLFWQRSHQEIDALRLQLFTSGDESQDFFEEFSGSATSTKWNPRIGLAWTPGPYGVRAAWQRWLQPVSTSTLAPVATAGIPIDDRLVAAGGKAERTAVQGYYDLNGRAHLSIGYDNKKVRNLGQLGFRIPVPQIQFVDLLRNQQVVNVNNSDLLEDTPDFDEGRVETFAASGNFILTPQWSIAARYAYSKNRATIFERDGAGNIVSANDDAKVPFIPRDLATLGFTWVSPWRIYLSAMAVHRSERFADRDNTVRLQRDTTTTAAVFWESENKRFIIGAGAGNIGSKVNKEAYVIDARYRF